MPKPGLVIFHLFIQICFLSLSSLPYALRYCPLRTVSPVLLWLLQWEVCEQEIHAAQEGSEAGASLPCSLAIAVSPPSFRLCRAVPPLVPLTLFLTLDVLV